MRDRWRQILTIMTMLQSDLMLQTYYLIGDCGLDFGLESDFDPMTKIIHLLVGAVPAVRCSLRTDFHLAAGLAEG